MPVFRSKKLITERHADPVTMDHIIELRKENERLRSDEKKYQEIISKLIAKKVADEYWSKVLHSDDIDPWAALKGGE